ncbi:galactose-3-O-sulfotransferase 3 [Elysia marginata]|uniref:Galactose-3-O-sulfotransferase 3 n=1 Tax=Elysia marginata TaxID=1093978 RepID=A0AAV4HZN6_9GAST|nr:galactose-3-O-sulfotransferase 3 [Elysia marginata]
MAWSGIEPTTSRSRLRRANHSATLPPATWRHYLGTVAGFLCLCIILLLYLGRNETLSRPVLLLPAPRIPQEDSLPEITQVVFAKVHKAASSTVQNILLRFAMRRNLSVLLPSKGAIISQSSFEIDPRKMSPHPEGKDKFDILCSHVVYDAKEIAKYFPDNAIRVAILREPMQQALSALVYYATQSWDNKLQKVIKKYPKDPINGFLRNPKEFYKQSRKYGPMTSYINNRMSLDLGFDWHHLESSKDNMTEINLFLKQVEDEFDLILISDYFDESMVLLRRYLHWQMKDIIYLKSNTAKPRPDTSPYMQQPIITADVAKSFRRWDRIDYELYDYFLPKFLQAIESELNFKEEVDAFKKIQASVLDFCFKKDDERNESLNIEKSEWTDRFTVSRTDCDLMKTKEIPLVKIARRKQLTRYKKYIRKIGIKEKPFDNSSTKTKLHRNPKRIYHFKTRDKQ